MASVEEIIGAYEAFQEDVVLETSDHALSTLASMVNSDSVDLSPQFQRRDRWDIQKQSQLIESFVLNIPVPPVYLAEADRGRYDVIDGKQRLTAIALYLRDGFMLRNLTRFPALVGLHYSELPAEIQSTLNFRPLRTVTLLRQSSATAKYEVFHRLNSGGQVLNAQEIRNVLYRGPLNDLVYNLSEDVFLQQQLKIGSARSPAYRNMTDVEWVLRFFALRASWRRFSGDYRVSMDNFMATHQDEGPQAIRNLERTFITSLRACEAVFGVNAFKRPDRGSWRDQAIAGVYDAEMVAFAEVTEEIRAAAIGDAQRVVSDVRALFQNDSDFEQAARQATNTPGRVRYRISRMIEVLERSV